MGRMSIRLPKKRTIFVPLAIMALLTLSVILGMLVKRSSLDSKPTIDLLTIKDSEAANHIGEKVEVRGVVFEVYTSRKGYTFINIGGEFPNQLLTVFADAELLTEKAFLESLEGKKISIIGRIKAYQAKPLINAHTKSQIKVSD